MKRRSITLAMLLCMGLSAWAGSGSSPANDRNEVRFITNNKLKDNTYQAQLRQSLAWQQFVAVNGAWSVEFNENNGQPHRAYGQPIPVAGATPEQAALNFLSDQLLSFRIPMEELELAGTSASSKYRFINFTQNHQGIEVLFSRTVVKLDMNNRVVMFGTDADRNIDLNILPTITSAAAISIAEQGLFGTVGNSVLTQGLFILPIPGNKEYVHHLVYEVMVELTNNDGTPARYRTWIDAHNGKVLSRINTVLYCGHSDHGEDEHASEALVVDVNLSSNLYIDNPWVAATNQPLPNAKVVINGTTYYTDGAGNLNAPITGPVSGDFDLAGYWSTVRTNGTTPSMSIILQDGANAVTFDGDASIRERSAYFHVNIIHDYMKEQLPAFTGMDFSLTTNVDIAGNCNAFYDGSSINFLEEGNDCQSYANVGDVVYHEYGHGINDNFYQDNGGNFINGAMGEGYADVWAFSPFEDPILADGQSLSNSTDYIRRYDIDPKVYPIDLVGQVHADGEIIAGAWWDTYLLLGSDMDTTMYLFAEAYAGLQATTPNGNEGEAYRDVLLDALQADDDDGDITNGTPNGNEIVEGFAIHGITLLSNVELVHDPVSENEENDDILIEAELNLTFPFTQYLGDVSLFYRLNGDPTITEVPMANVGPDSYEGLIPGQPKGTVVAYYLGVYDIFQQLSGVQPQGAALEDPNIPYFILVDMAVEKIEDADDVNELGNWEVGIPGDNATTGEWTLDLPVGSFGDIGPPIDFSTAVAPYLQHTDGGELCFLTGTSFTQQSPIGENDVDGGTTTLLGSPIDLTGYTNPVFTYWRWYINNPPTGANPGADWWQAFISDDGGSTWTPIEETKTSDKSWRRFAFRVQDYVSITNEVVLKFNVSDSIRLGQNLDGGSLIEGAIDDIYLWDNASSIGIEEISARVSLEVFPNPAQNDITISFELENAEEVRLVILNGLGQEVWKQERGKLGEGLQLIQVDTGNLAEGLYTLDIRIGSASARKKLTIVR